MTLVTGELLGGRRAQEEPFGSGQLGGRDVPFFIGKGEGGSGWTYLVDAVHPQLLECGVGGGLVGETGHSCEQGVLHDFLVRGKLGNIKESWRL